jgi:hypothetical protein
MSSGSSSRRGGGSSCSPREPASACGRRRCIPLHPSEIMTIASLFQQSHYRTFKAYYTRHVQQHLREEFPQVVSYSRFVELLPTVLAPLIA